MAGFLGVVFAVLQTVVTSVTTFYIMDIKLLLFVMTGLFTVSCLFFGTRNGFYDSENYHGNGSAH
ncbi:MAG: hypothetical protein AAFQ74_12660 [Cyanobacteria bacterium J06623_4]